MKKIKLITPILGLAAISSSLIPLTSCNKNQKDVKKEYWDKAIDAICDITQDRNFTMKGSGVLSQDGYDPLPYVGTVKVANFISEVQGTKDDPTIRKNNHHHFLTHRYDLPWEVKLNPEGKFKRVFPLMFSLTEGYRPNWEVGFSYGLAFKDCYDQIEIDNEWYKVTLYNEDALKAVCWFKFNSDKLISNVKAEVKYKGTYLEKEKELGLTFEASFSDYGTTKQAYKTEYDAEIDKEIRIFDQTGVTPSHDVVERENAYLIPKKTDTELKFNAIEFSYPITTTLYPEGTLSIVVGGQILDPDQYNVTEKKISFKQTMSNEKQISIVLMPHIYHSNATAKLITE